MCIFGSLLYALLLNSYFAEGKKSWLDFTLGNLSSALLNQTHLAEPLSCHHKLFTHLSFIHSFAYLFCPVSTTLHIIISGMWWFYCRPSRHWLGLSVIQNKESKHVRKRKKNVWYQWWILSNLRRFCLTATYEFWFV